MGIKVKFFASMRDLMGDDRVLDATTIQQHKIHTVDDVWNYCAQGRERPANVLVAVNMDYVDAQSTVKEDDEVAFFPPVTGG